MDPSILSYQKSPSAEVVHNDGTDVAQNQPEESPSPVLAPYDGPRYYYQVEQLFALSESPLVKCPEMKTDVRALAYVKCNTTRPLTRTTMATRNNTRIERAKYKELNKGQGFEDAARSNYKNQRWNHHDKSAANSNNNLNNRQRKGNNHFNRRDDKKHQNSMNSHHNEFFEEFADEPEWLEESPGEDTTDGLDMGKTVEEFEAWKAKKKIEDMKKAGIEVPEMTENSEAPSSSLGGAPVLAAPSVDRMFGMWGSSTSTTATASPKTSRIDDFAPSSLPSKAPSNSSSKFSRFFSSKDSPQGGDAVLASNTTTPPAANPPLSTQPPPPSSNSDADKEGMQRVLSMLSSSSQPAPPANSPAVEGAAQHVSDQHHQLPPQQPQQSQQQQPIPAPAPVQGDNDNDLFFKSLLSKGVPNEKSASPSQSPASAKSEKVVSPNQPVMMSRSSSGSKQQPPSQPQQQKQHNQQQSEQQQQHQQQPQMQHLPPGMPPPPHFPPGMMMPPPPGMPPPPPGMMFPHPPPPPPPHMQGSGNQFPPAPGFPPFFGNFPPPPPPGHHGQMPPMPPPPPPHMSQDGSQQHQQMRYPLQRQDSEK